MGFLHKSNLAQKNISDLMKKDFENRADGFDGEYQELVRKYRCVHQAILDFQGGGNLGIIPKEVIIDATKILEQRQKNEENKKEEK